MPSYFRNPDMQNGGPFKCHNCGKTLAVKLKGNCFVQFKCPRCHAFISVKMNEPVNWNQKETVSNKKKEFSTA